MNPEEEEGRKPGTGGPAGGGPGICHQNSEPSQKCRGAGGVWITGKALALAQLPRETGGRPVTSLHTLEGTRFMAHWSLSQDSTVRWGLFHTGEISSRGLAACLAHRWNEDTLAILTFRVDSKPRRERCYGDMRVTG